jgi:hypothetical protein
VPKYFIGHSVLSDGKEETVSYLWDPIDAESEADAIRRYIISIKPTYADFSYDDMIDNWHRDMDSMIYAVEVDPEEHRALGEPYLPEGKAGRNIRRGIPKLEFTNEQKLIFFCIGIGLFLGYLIWSG